jgi:pimeloyl-ACP methyl ester carboxylesterase
MEAFELFTVKANGITHRVASVKGCLPARPTVPLVMFLHGWPESWYSWRHQLLALASAGYPAVAPDMRGFGGTDAPDHVREYTVDRLCLDVIKISESLGYSRIIVIGHDFGSYLAWHLALLHPKVVVAVCGMSVPYLGHSPRNEPLLSRLQRNFGTCLQESPYCASRSEQENAKFHYILHHNLPHVEEEYDRNCEEVLYRLYSFKPGDDCEPPEVTDKRMFPLGSRDVKAKSSELLDARSAAGLWERLPRPKCLASFLTPEDYSYIVRQYYESGFAGGLKWYQAMDANWLRTRHLKGKKIEQPSLFLVGAEDRDVLNNHGGLENVVHCMHQNCSRLTNCIVLPNAGHWLQQERYNDVSSALLEFLEEVSSPTEHSQASKL